MMQHNIRRVVRDLARIGAAISAVMWVANLRAGRHASAAGFDASTLQLQVPPGTAAHGQPLAAGASATPFALAPPAGASCSGDSATGGYRVQSYIVPASVDPGTLTFDSSGPTPQDTGVNVRLPLFSSIGGSPFIDQTTAVATTAGGEGLLTGLPSFSFAVLGTDGPALLPAGTYNVGLACTLGVPSPTQEDKFWNVQMTFAADPTDQPSGITWTVVGTEPPPPSTTATSPATVAASIPAAATPATTTSTPGATDSTTASTTGSSTTSTTIRLGSTTTTAAVQQVAGAAGASNGGTSAGSATSRLAIVMWIAALLVLGRMAVLVTRPLRTRRREAR